MANIFFKQGKMDIADSLYRQVRRTTFCLVLNNSSIFIFKVVKMWCKHLIEVVEEKTRISELDTILGKIEEVESELIGN